MVQTTHDQAGAEGGLIIKSRNGLGHAVGGGAFAEEQGADTNLRASALDCHFRPHSCPWRVRETLAELGFHLSRSRRGGRLVHQLIRERRPIVIKPSNNRWGKSRAASTSAGVSQAGSRVAGSQMVLTGSRCGGFCRFPGCIQTPVSRNVHTLTMSKTSRQLYWTAGV